MPPRDPTSAHAFVICQVGAEAALKREIGRIAPDLRAGYQRPSLVTFRATQPVGPDLELDSVLARHWGMSLGSHASLGAAIEVIRTLPAPLRLHVFARDSYRPDEAPEAAVEAAERQEREVNHSLRERIADQLLDGQVAKPGDLVLNVVMGGDDPILLGLHRHKRGRAAHAGGRYPVDVPSDSPSRAYRKIEEAIACFELPFLGGDRALELGAAPGGAAYALARRGVEVLAVDPADMDPTVLRFVGPQQASVRHLKIPMAGLAREELAQRIDWILMDVNLAPQVALRTARSLASATRRNLLGMVLTLKLNQWSFLDELASFHAAAREMGLVESRLRQLPSHRQEICLVGLTPMGLARLERTRGRSGAGT